ncbi:MAG: hypothetical protein JRF05_08765 [Deltaproteobacteria bacterium]|nr:hypothetical protein [Deltaproteobacteria bacterium]
MMLTGFTLGIRLVLVVGLVSTIHFCIQLPIHRAIFWFPSKTGEEEALMCEKGILCHR